MFERYTVTPRGRPRPGLRTGTLLAAMLGLVLGAAFLAPCQASTVWKWRDASGRVTVSDQPPPREVPDRDILERPARAAATPRSPAAGPAPAAGASSAPAAPRVDPELEARRRAQSAQARAAASAPSADDARRDAQRRENCSRARAMLATLDSGQRMARLNDKGERVVLDDAQRAQEARRAREVIAAECG